MWLYLAALSAVLCVTVHGDLQFCGSGWTFEKTCLGMSYPTAYVEQKGSYPAQCVIAIEDETASATQIQNICGNRIQDKRGKGATPYDSTTGSVEQLEKYFALKQTGFYYAADGKQVVPTSGKKQTAQGYLCSLKDEYGCEEGWVRFGSHCYYAVNESETFTNAQRICQAYDGAVLAQIRNDEENKFVAMFARTNLFKDKIGKETIWGPLEYRQDMDLWMYANVAPETNDRLKEKRVAYMRWWSSSAGTGPVANRPSSGFTASTIYATRNDNDRTAYFGYWDTARPTDQKMFICSRQMQLL